MFCRPGDTIRFLAFAQIAASGLGKSGITVTIAINEGTTNKVTAASATAMTAVDATNQPGLYYYDYTVTSTFFGSIVGQATTTDTTCIVRSLEMLFQSVAWLLTCASGTASAGASGSITLAGASATDSLYNGETVQIIAGTGAGQARTIIGYVGSTKVATVGRNWAVTPDNTSVFSVIPGEHPRVDDNLAMIVQSGTGTGQISLSSGTVTVGTNNDKTGYALTQTFPTNFSSLGISAGGKINGVVLADAVTAAVTLPSIPANWITAAGINAAALNGKGDWLLSSGYTAPPSSATIAGAVWDVTLASHLTAGTTGYALNAAGSAGDPWGTALPGTYGAGSAGYIIGNRLDAAVSSRAAPGDAMALTGDLTATMKTSVATAVAAISIDGVTFQNANKLMFAVLTGKTIGAGTTTNIFYAPDGTTARVTTTFDTNKDRNTVNLTP